jgi:L-ascorbate metabolism protein UlaG (beta-lactamase superfamily)
MAWWIGNSTALLKDNDGSALVTDSAVPPKKEWSWVMSVFTYKKSCVHKTDGSIKTEYVHIPIEPTAALARDPRKVI